MILSLRIRTIVMVIPCLEELHSLLSRGLGSVLSVESIGTSKLELLLNEESGCLREESAEKMLTNQPSDVQCCFHVQEDCKRLRVRLRFLTTWWGLYPVSGSQLCLN